jgi:hypothetical protein
MNRNSLPLWTRNIEGRVEKRWADYGEIFKISNLGSPDYWVNVKKTEGGRMVHCRIRRRRLGPGRLGVGPVEYHSAYQAIPVRSIPQAVPCPSGALDPCQSCDHLVIFRA